MQNQSGTVLAPSSLLGEGLSLAGTSPLQLLLYFFFFPLFLDTSVQTLLQRGGLVQVRPWLIHSPKKVPLFDGVVRGEVLLHHFAPLSL